MNYVIIISALVACFAIAQIIQNVYLLRLNNPQAQKIGIWGTVFSSIVALISLITLLFSIFVHTNYNDSPQKKAFPAFN